MSALTVLYRVKFALGRARAALRRGKFIGRRVNFTGRRLDLARSRMNFTKRRVNLARRLVHLTRQLVHLTRQLVHLTRRRVKFNLGRVIATRHRANFPLRLQSRPELLRTFEGEGAAMKLGIEPIVDIVFKYLFANPEHSSIALSLINSVLRLSGRPQAASIAFANPFSLADFSDAKQTVVDVRAKDENDRDFLVEMQIRTEPSTLERMLDTWSRTYSAQIGSGELYEEHRPVISIWILDSRLFPGENWLHILEVQDRPSGGPCLDSFLIVAIELPKRASLPDFDESLILRGGIDEWLYLLDRGQELEPGSPALIGATPEIREAMEAMEVFSKDEKARYEYEKQIEFVRVQRGLMKYERQEGRKEGREENNLEIARKLKRLGVSVEVIAAATGLSKEAIEGLPSP